MQVSASVDDPHSAPSHGTVENHHIRRYLLEDIMSASPGERLLILVSSSHPYWGEYINVINRCSPLPRVIQGLLSFFQIHVKCVKNAQLDKDYNKESILALLYGNQRGGIGIEYITDPKLESVEITWLELFENTGSIQLWGSSPATRDFRKLFNGLSSLDTKASLFVRMSEEVYGDRSLTFDLISSFNQVQQSSINKNETRLLATNTVKTTISNTLSNESIAPLSDVFDILLESSFSACYGGFVSITAPVIEADTIDILVARMREAIPTQWLVIQNLLGYTNAHKVARRSHLVKKLFPRKTFFLLVSLSRVRNPRHFSSLGAITAASSYGVGDTDNARRVLKIFGISISRSVLSTKIR